MLAGMLVNHWQKLCRLHRNTALVLILCAGVAWFSANITNQATAATAWMTLGVSATAVVMVIASELSRWLLSRMGAAVSEESPPPKALPWVTMAMLVGQWVGLSLIAVWSGWLWMVSLLALSVVGACFVCRTRVALGLAIGSGLVLVAQAFLPIASTTLPTWVSALQAGLTLLVWFQAGHYVAMLVAGTNHQVNRLQSLATTDALTGLMNRRLLMHQCQAEFSRARRHNADLSVAMFDIDHFKKVNDIYGHQVGDRILKELGKLIQENVRDCDTVGRYGGEEFCLILPETRQTEAADLMERLRVMVASHVFCMPDNPLTVTMSVGIAQWESRTHTCKEDIIHQADAALYEAKQQGRNRVVYGVLPVPKISYTSASQRLSGQLF